MSLPGFRPAHVSSESFSGLACFFIAESIKHHGQVSHLKRRVSVSEVEEERVHTDVISAIKKITTMQGLGIRENPSKQSGT